MVIVKKFNDMDILRILIERAADSLPEESKGKLEARFNEDDSVDVFFLQKLPDGVKSITS